jgi:hypothetical protein
MKSAMETSPALPSPPARENEERTGFAVAALVCGIASLFIVFAQFTGVAAIVLGSIGLSRGNSGAGSRSLATSGIALGGVGLALFFFLNFFPSLMPLFN